MPTNALRIDKQLWFLRWAKTRSLAQHMVSMGHIRRNGCRVERCSVAVGVGDILVFPWGNCVRIIEILALPDRRGPAAEAQSCYRVLDETQVIPIAGAVAEFANRGEAHP